MSEEQGFEGLHVQGSDGFDLLLVTVSSPQTLNPKRRRGWEVHFDALILGGCKFYCLRKKGCEDIAKCKGFKKSKGEELAFEDFEMMANKGVKKQKQVQFLCPKMNHLSVDEKFSMRTPKVTKKFRFLYNKGAVHDDGTITSFYN